MIRTLSILFFLGATTALNGGLAAEQRTRGTGTPSADTIFRPLVERYFTAWSTRNPDRAASLYSQDDRLAVFDILGQQRGWNAYREARGQLFEQFASVQLVPGRDLDARRQGGLGWTSVSFRGSGVLRDQQSVTIEGRHTAVWERRGPDWLIVHEHLSIPFTRLADLSDRFPASGGEAADRTALNGIVQVYQEAWNGGDAERLAGLWHEDGDVVVLSSSMVSRGREQLTRMWTDTMARRTQPFNTSLAASIASVRFLEPDIAILEGAFDYFKQGGGRQQAGAPAAQERFSAVATRREGRWAIASIRVAAVPPPPEPSDSKRRRR